MSSKKQKTHIQGYRLTDQYIPSDTLHNSKAKPCLHQRHQIGNWCARLAKKASLALDRALSLKKA